MLERLHELTSDLGRAEWHVLGALASERKLPRSCVERALRESSTGQGSTGAWLDSKLRQGLLVDAGEARLPLSARRSEAERGLALTSELRALVLRRLAEQNELEHVRRLAQTLVGQHSLSGFVTALYSGDVTAVERALPELKRRLVGDEPAAFARAALREAVCSGFDPTWFERTWSRSAAGVAEQVLRDAILTLDAVDPAYAWALSRAESAGGALSAATREHALLRGEYARVLALEGDAASTHALSRAAAASYVGGDLARAEHLLNESVASAGQRELPLTGTPTVSALLALLAVGRGTPDGLALARRVIRRSVDTTDTFVRDWPGVSPVEAANRALRTLIRQLGKSEAERARFDAHQLPAQAPAWETLLLALTTFLHERSPVKRTAWARRLRTDGKRWEASYLWFARQAFGLATALRDPDLDRLDDLPAPRPGELLIVDLVQPRPEWRTSLEALAAFAKTAARAANIVSRRVAWFVDMTRGELTRPALEEYREGTGWVRARRQEAAELWERRAELPPEDVAVLIASRDGDGIPVLGPEALAALAGHPRVFDGARGRNPIEIVPGTCRIETRHEHGHVVVSVEPRGAVEGINVVVEGETRVLVYRVSSQMAKLTTLLPAGMRIPERHEQEALAVLARLSEHVEIRTDRLGAQRSVAADSTPCLRISSEAGAFWVEAGVRPFGSAGRFFQPGSGRAAVTAHVGEELLDSIRDLEEERRRFTELVERCPTLIVATTAASTDAEEVSEPARVYSFALSEDSLLQLLVELRECELGCQLEWRSGPRLSARGRLKSSNLHGSLRPVKGWYLVQGSVRIDDVTELALSELVEMPFTKSGRFVRLPAGDFVEIEQRVGQLLSALRACAQPGAPGELRVPRSALEALRTLTQPNSGFDVAG